MNIGFFGKFNFFSLPIDDQKKVTDFFVTDVCKNEMFKKYILENLRDAKDSKERAVFAYLLFEATIEYVRVNVKDRKNIIVDAFFTEQLKYDEILAGYERISHHIKASTITFSPILSVVAPSQPNVVAQYPDFSVTRIKQTCNEMLTRCIDFYGNKLINKQALNESEIQHAQQMKVLRTILDGLQPQDRVDRPKIIIILKYMLEDTLLGMIDKKLLLSCCTSDTFEKKLMAESNITVGEQKLRDAFNQFSNKVEKNDLALLKKELLSKCENTEVTTSESASKSGLFSPRNQVDNNSEAESAGPPKRSRTKTPPPRI